MHLSDAELSRFHDQGYLVKPGLFAEADLQPIRDAIDEMTDAALEELREAGRDVPLHRDVPFHQRLVRIAKDDAEAADAVLARIKGPAGGGYHGPAMLGMLRHEPLLDCVADLVGPEVVGSSVYRIRPKLPGLTEGEVPWHQDSGYFMAHCDRHLIVTCWIPLVDATLANGCLHVIPGVHGEGILRHCTGGHGGFLEVPTDALPEREPVPVEMEAGGVLFMTNLTPHASFRNSTDEIRWSVDLRFQGADTPTNVGEPPESYTPDRDPVTMACYPPEADFVLRSPSHPEREVRTVGAFEAIRERYDRARPDMPGRGWTELT